MDETPVTRVELERVRDIAEAALMLVSRILGERPLTTPDSLDDAVIHERLLRARVSPEMQDSKDLRHYVEGLLGLDHRS